jgi:hypothetical protein
MPLCFFLDPIMQSGNVLFVKCCVLRSFAYFFSGRAALDGAGAYVCLSIIIIYVLTFSVRHSVSSFKTERFIAGRRRKMSRSAQG